MDTPGQPPPSLPTLCTPDPHDPNKPAHVQYLIKWRNRSYLHCTWESEHSLTSQDIKGIKKFHNFVKKEEERDAWEKMASPEDVEYAKCQEELGEQLLGQFTQVERVIGECTHTHTHTPGSAKHQYDTCSLVFVSFTLYQGSILGFSIRGEL